MKYPNTGMYNYCENLFLHFSNDSDLDCYFYAHPQTSIPKEKKITIKPLDRFYLKAPADIKLWHTTSQLSDRIPKGKVKLVLTIHDLNFLYGSKPQWKKDRELKKIQKKIDRADYITCISKFTLNDVTKHLKLGNTPVKVIHNGVTLNQFPEFETPKFKPVHSFLFSLGVIAEKKNIHVLIPMLKYLEQDLVIAGLEADSNYREKLQELVLTNNLEQRVHFIGEISEAEKFWYLNNCEGFVFPSISEGFGIPPVEAMRLGKPVFLSKATSLPEIGGNIAYYFEDFEAKNMAKIISEGIIQFKENNRTKESIVWSNQFTWEKSAQLYKEVYVEVLGM